MDRDLKDEAGGEGLGKIKQKLCPIPVAVPSHILMNYLEAVRIKASHFIK